MVIAAALDQDPKPSQGENRTTWGARGGDKKDPDLEKIIGLSFLIVDDSRFARTTVKNVLHVLGIRNVTEAEDAEQALQLVEKQNVDVIIVDFEMPGMSGAEFTWRLRRSKTERLQQLPVIMVSNHADEPHIRKAINSGVNEFLPKPFSQGGLYSRLRRAAVNPKPFIVSEGYIGPDRRLKYTEGDEKLVSTRGLPPVVLMDFTGPQPKRVDVGNPEMGTFAASLALPPTPAPAAPAPTAPAAPRFSVMAESAPPAPGEALSKTVDEKLKD